MGQPWPSRGPSDSAIGLGRTGDAATPQRVAAGAEGHIGAHRRANALLDCSAPRARRLAPSAASAASAARPMLHAVGLPPAPCRPGRRLYIESGGQGSRGSQGVTSTAVQRGGMNTADCPATHAFRHSAPETKSIRLLVSRGSHDFSAGLPVWQHARSHPKGLCDPLRPPPGIGD